MAVITQEQFDKLDREDITKKEYDGVISLISSRVGEVWRGILKQQNRKLSWYDFDNGHDGVGGHFDPNSYGEQITLTGEWKGWLDDDNPFVDSFPTRFLWEENFLEEVKKDTEKYKKEEKDKKAKAKLKREETKKCKTEMRKQIEAKLTKDQLKYIKFK